MEHIIANCDRSGTRVLDLVNFGLWEAKIGPGLHLTQWACIKDVFQHYLLDVATCTSSFISPTGWALPLDVLLSRVACKLIPVNSREQSVICDDEVEVGRVQSTA